MNESTRQMPIFIKWHDFMLWLVPRTNDFPKIHRYTITKRMLDAAMDFMECLLEADNCRGAERMKHLRQADLYLNKVRNYIRLTHQLRWINNRRYEHAGRMVAELGRLLGGWQKVTADTQRQYPVV